MFRLLAVTATLFTLVFLSVANAKTTRLWFDDGSYVDVVTDDKGTYTMDSEGTRRTTTGDRTEKGHKNMIDDVSKTGKVIRL